MAGYTRQSTFTDGDTITAALFNNEFDHLLAVFSNATGHKHDGTASEGPVIGLIGDAGETTPNNKVLIDSANNHIEFYIEVSSNPVQQLYIADGAILPVTDNDIDLGSSSLEFKDLFIDGTANIDSLVADTADINGGTLDNVTIGATTAAAGTFTTVTTTSNVIVGGNLTVSGTTTTVNSNEVNIGDNIIVLNSDETGTPSQNGGIEIERGTSTNVSLVWNETNDYWTFGSNHLNFPDNSKAYFGDSNDLQIYHDGSNSYIEDANGLGNLILRGSANVQIEGANGENCAIFNENSSVRLFFDNAEKLATASGGVTITGTATATAFSGPLTGNVTGDVTGNVTGNLTGSVLTAAQTNITSLGTLSSLAVSGDLTVDTSTLKVDSSNNRVGIGTASPSSLLHLNSGNRDLNFILADSPASGNAGVQITAGASDFLGLYGGSSNGELLLGSNNTERMRIDSSGNLGIGTSSPGARLQINGSSTDSSAHALIARNSGGTSLFSIRNDGRIDIPTGNLNVTNDVAVSGNLTVTGNATINGNLTFGDANTDTVSFGADIDSNIIPDDDNTYDLGSSSQEWKDLYIDGVVYADQIDLGDNEKIRLGASQDLEIFHNGSNSVIKDGGTGNLYLQGTNLLLTDSAGYTFIECIDSGNAGTVKLYHSASEKLATTSTGIDVTGGISASSTVNAFGNGSVALQWGDTTALGALSFDGSANPLIRSYSSKPLVFQTNGANERMRIDSSGNVGIGTTSPNYLLDVEGTGSTLFRLNSTSGAAVLQISVPDTSSICDLNFGDTGDTTSGQIRYRHNGDSMAFDTAGSERLRIDSSGKLLVGKTSGDTTNTVGHELKANGIAVHTTDGTGTLFLNRKTSDGTIIELRKDNSAVGSINAQGGRLTIGSDDTHIFFDSGDTPSIRPHNGSAATDGVIDIGESGTRFKDLHLSGNANIGGNLTVSGTTTTLNTATLDVEDKNITLNKGSGDTSSTADGAGITIQDAVDASNDATILWNASADRFDFSHGLRINADDQSLTVGAGGDFALSHNGTDTFMANNTGHFYITTTSDDKDIIFRSDDGSGGVTEYFKIDGSLADGTSTFVRLPDNGNLGFGASNDLRIYHDTSHSYINNFTGNLEIRNDADDGDINFRTDNGSGGLTTYFAIDGGGEYNRFYKNAYFTDNVKALFGSSSDLEIYHDGSHSYISNVGTGDLRIRGSYVKIQGGNTENMLVATQNGAVELYHDNNKKFETTSTGIDVTGLVKVTDQFQSISGSRTLVMNANFSGLGAIGMSSNDHLTFVTNNTERMRLDNSGSLGIGTTSPTQELHVDTGTNSGGLKITASDADAFIHFNEPTDNKGFYISLDGNNNSGSNHSLSFFSQNGGTNTNRMMITNDGKVGIGTTSPSRKLTVQGGSGDNLPVRIIGGASTTQSSMEFQDPSTTADYKVTLGSKGDNLFFQAGGSERARIDSSGNVGIGTSSPTQALHVVGNGLFTGGLTVGDSAADTFITRGHTHLATSGNNVGIGTTSPSEKLHVQNGSSGYSGSYNARTQAIVESNNSTGTVLSIMASNTGYSGLFFGDQDGEAVGQIHYDHPTNALRFATSGSEHMRIDTSGNVGIGTTTPQGKLDVDGDLRITRNIVSNTVYQMLSFGSDRTNDDYGGVNKDYWRVNLATPGASTDGGSSAHAFGTLIFSGVTGSNTTYADRLAITAGGNVGIGTNTPSSPLHVKYTGTGDGLTLESSEAGASASPDLVLYRNSSSPADADQIGNIFFRGKDDGGNDANYALILGAINDASDGTEDGNLFFRTASAGSLANRLSIVSDKVGIGTDSPSEKLHVDGNIKTTGIIYSGGSLRGSSGSATKLILDATSTTTELHAAGTTGIIFKNNGNAERMRLTDTGLGIGTTSPSEKLHVVGDVLIGTGISYNASANDILTIGATNRTAVNNGTYFNYQYKVSGAATGQDLTLQAARNIDGSSEDVESIFQYDASADAQIFFTNATERMRIDSSGNVGIGTSSPGVQLDIESSGNNSQLELTATDGTDQSFGLFSATGNNSNGAGFYIQDKTANAIRLKVDSSGKVGINTSDPDGQGYSFAEDLVVLGGNSADDGVGITLRGNGKRYGVLAFGDNADPNSGEIFYDHTANSMSFRTNDQIAATIDSSGNVGIGTTSPATKLEVAGNITLPSDGQIKFRGTNHYPRIFASSNDLLINLDNGSGSNFTAFKIDNATGNIGIGTTGPSDKLDIVGGGLEITQEETTDAIALLDSSNSNTKYLSIQGDNGDCNINAPAGALVLQRAGTQRVSVGTSGVAINGSLSKTSGSFKIDHPLKPDTHHLVHSFVEGPQADNLYRGVIKLNNGKATIDLDDWFGMTAGTFLALNRDIQAFVNNSETWDAVRANVQGSQLVIECQNPDSNAEVSWLVIGERQDKEIHDSILTDDNGKIIIEPKKT